MVAFFISSGPCREKTVGILCPTPPYFRCSLERYPYFEQDLGGPQIKVGLYINEIFHGYPSVLGGIEQVGPMELKIHILFLPGSTIQHIDKNILGVSGKKTVFEIFRF